MRAAFSPITPSAVTVDHPQRLSKLTFDQTDSFKKADAKTCRFSGLFPGGNKDNGKPYIEELKSQFNSDTPLSLNTKIMVNRAIYLLKTKQVGVSIINKVLSPGVFHRAAQHYQEFGEPKSWDDYSAMVNMVKVAVKAGVGLLDRPAAPEEIDGVTREGIAWSGRN